MNSFFKVSERNHLGMILMTELAKSHKSGDFIGLPVIAEHMKLPLGYLEEIALALKEGGLVEGKRGRTGGYRLAKPSSFVTIDQILIALEGPIALVPCQESNIPCPVQKDCGSQSLWNGLRKTLIKSLQKTTLADLS